MRAITTTVTETVAVPLAKTFAGTAAFDVPATMRPHGPIPGVQAVEGHTAPYSAVGQVRDMTLTDNSAVREETTAFIANKSFAYRIDSFTGPFRSLVDHGVGEWRFASLGPDKTRIDWIYSFTPKSAAATPLVWFIVKALWRGYMAAALKRVKTSIETSS